ncbi:MAG: PKD domain-containing protein [Chloroflexia bacterium]|nr:PKD domain-containing protein [Chloroflexia bacterium]
MRSLARRSARLLLPLLFLLAMPLFSGAGPRYRGPIYDGPELDYQPSIIRVQPSGRLLVILERIRLSDFYGDMYAVYSDDDGETWSTPQWVLGEAWRNERHPSLLQLGPDRFVLFYLVDETGSGSYRLHRATSTDGLTDWTDRGALDLGWATPGEINPSVVRAGAGSLTMAYHRLSGPSYIARSTDEGVTWDARRTQVSPANAQLPRLAYRERDGLYLVSYQVGSSNLDLYAKASYDPYDWDVPQIPVSTDLNTHDSQPIVLADGAFLLIYAKTFSGYFDLAYRVSCNGLNWLPEVRQTYEPAFYDTQPHPWPLATPERILLVWPHQDSGTPYQDHDLWVDNELLIPADVRPSFCGSTQGVEPAFFEPALHLPLTYTLHLPNHALSTTAWLDNPIPADTVYRPGSLWASSGRYGYDPIHQAITWTGAITAGAAVTVSFQVSTTALFSDGQAVWSVARLTDAQGLVYAPAAAALADSLPPRSLILEPEAGQWFSSSQVLVTGVASDTASGVYSVAVNLDGGVWLPAQGRESWTFLAGGLAEGTHHLRSRTRDWLQHDEIPGAGISFTVDTLPPQLVGTSPPPGALEVPVSAALVLTFSEAILSGSLGYASQPDPGGWSVGWNPSRTVAYLDHVDLLPDSRYTVTVAGARDWASNLLEPYTWSFTTQCEPIQIVSVTTALSGCQAAFGAVLSGTAPYSYSWDFGSFGSSALPTPTVDFGADGSYPYTLIVRNCSGAYSDTAAGLVELACEPPCEAVAVLSVTTAFSGCQAAFSAELSGTAPYSYSWDFGAFGSSALPTPTVDFGGDGSYPYTLSVYNCGGLYSVTAFGVVDLACEAPCRPVEWLTYTAEVTGCQAAFSAQAGGTAPLDWRWAVGDGLTATVAAPTHFYSASGGYTVTLEVWNCAGSGYRREQFVLSVSCPSLHKSYRPLLYKNAAP